MPERTISQPELFQPHSTRTTDSSKLQLIITQRSNKEPEDHKLSGPGAKRSIKRMRINAFISYAFTSLSQ